MIYFQYKWQLDQDLKETIPIHYIDQKWLGGGGGGGGGGRGVYVKLFEFACVSEIL